MGLGQGGGRGFLRSSLKIILFSLLSELWHKGHGNVAVEKKVIICHELAYVSVLVRTLKEMAGWLQRELWTCCEFEYNESIFKVVCANLCLCVLESDSSFVFVHIQ